MAPETFVSYEENEPNKLDCYIILDRKDLPGTYILAY